MDTFSNLRAFIDVAEESTFSAAARKRGLSTTVVTKRVTQLEERIGRRLFQRTTRVLKLTPIGRQYLHRARMVVAEADDLLARMGEAQPDVVDHLRIKAPTTLTAICLTQAFASFQSDNPNVRLEITLMDRAVDPVLEGFDVAIGAFPLSFVGVSDVPLFPLRRVLCAAPSYLSGRAEPAHPRDLVLHDCLSFTPTGPDWTFASARGPVEIRVTPTLSSNDGGILLEGALRGRGIALLPMYLVGEALTAGGLVEVLGGYPVPDLVIKAMIPERRLNSAAVQKLLDLLRTQELASRINSDRPTASDA